MADTYTQLYIHIVFAVKGRQTLIPKDHKTELHQYITGIVTNRKQKMIQINSMPDNKKSCRFWLFDLCLNLPITNIAEVDSN